MCNSVTVSAIQHILKISKLVSGEAVKWFKSIYCLSSVRDTLYAMWLAK
jgi:hypothetical protein